MMAADVVTIIAVIVGPLLGVMYSMWRERVAETKRRRMAIFRDLMATRRRYLDVQHVAALNLVEIEFYGKKRVTTRFSELITLFEGGFPRREGEEDQAYNQRLTDEHRTRLTALLNEMARVLGYGFEQLEILKGGYAPQVYGDIEEDAMKARRLFAEFYEGKRAMPIAVVDYRTPEQFRAAAEAVAAKVGTGIE